MSGIVERVKTWHLVVAIPILWFVTGIGLGDYNSPFAFALACGMFVVMKRVGVAFSRVERVGRVVGWLGPSMFSVYLLHTNEVGFGFIKIFEPKIIEAGVPVLFVWLFTAIPLFVGGVLLDLPRRLFGRIVRG